METTAHEVVVPGSFNAEPTDRIYRVLTDHVTQSSLVRSWETREISNSLKYWFDQKEHQIHLLKDFAAWQKRKLDFQAVYNAYLLEAVSEEEFAEEADAYAIELKDVDAVTIGHAMDDLSELLPFDVSTSDFAEFFECEPDDVIAAIEAAGNNPKLLALLPSSDEHEEK